MTVEDIIKGSRRPVIIAHRGASFYHHENTMEAFEGAVAMGAEMVELDVRRTKDGVLMVHHDPDLDKVKVFDMTVDQIKHRSESAGYIVPTLVEVLRYCKDRIAVDIELKEPGYEEEVLETVLGIVRPDQFLVSSSHDGTVHTVKNLHPEIKTGLVLHRTPFPRLLKQLFPASRIKHTGVDVLMISERLNRLGFLGLNRGLGKPVWIYTVNDRKRLWEVITDQRIGAVFTDRPDVALFLRDLHVVSQNKAPCEGRRA